MMTLLALLTSLAAAQDAVTLSAVRYAQEGLSSASVTFHSNVSGQLDASLTCSGKSYRLSTAISEGKTYPMELAGLPKGNHACRGSLSLQAADGTSGEMPLSIDVEVLPPLKLTVKREDLDLAGRRLVVRGDRPIAKARVEVLGEGGKIIGSGELAGPATDAFALEWSQSAGDAIKLNVTAWDAHELPGKLELSPWSYAIPHEDVVFATNAYDVQASEVPKLEKAYADLEEVLRKYGSVVQVQLYVAGYTDTQGDPGSNQTLSENRARAIAAWFRKRGFQGPIWYQGFGESALAVATPDGTDEVRNRRAVYLLAAETPAISSEIPRSSWRKLD
jgi:outer membrane protein OmpA-like peptidoglycan-associated protein